MRTGTLHVLFGFFAALFVASQANIVAALGPVAPDLFQLQVTVSADAYRSIVEGWGAAELARYRTHFAWDTVHPLIYGTLLVLWTLVLHRRRAFSARGLRWLLTLALAPSVFDYVENAFHLYLEANRNAIAGATVALSGGAAILKWSCAGVVVLLLLVASLRGRRRSTASGAAATEPARPVAVRAQPVTSTPASAATGRRPATVTAVGTKGSTGSGPTGTSKAAKPDAGKPDTTPSGKSNGGKPNGEQSNGGTSNSGKSAGEKSKADKPKVAKPKNGKATQGGASA